MMANSNPAPLVTAEAQRAAMVDEPRISASVKYEAWISLEKRRLDEEKEDALDEVQKKAMKIVRKAHQEVRALFKEFGTRDENRSLALRYEKEIVDKAST